MNLSLDARSRQFLADLDRISDRQSRVQRQISSGFRISKPSDDPGQIIDILQLRSDIARVDTIGTNLSRVRAEVDTAESSLRVAEQLMERAKTLAAQTATSTATNRPAVAVEVRAIAQQLVDLTKTVSEGRYVFSGDLDQSKLYEFDWTQPGGINRLASAANTRQIEDVNGSRFSVSLNATQIFDDRDGLNAPTDNNVFNAVYTLGKALEANDITAVQNALPLINTAMDHLGRQLSFYGHAQNRLENAETLNQKAAIARKTELSRAQETDMPAAIVELTQSQVHQDAALNAQARRSTRTLFDYLG